MIKILENFYARYFNQPVGYTVPETIILSIIFVVAVYVLYRYFLKNLDIKIDRKFLLSLVPFIIFGGTLRSLGPGDAGVFTGYFFDTPGIYLLITFITIASILASRYLEKRTERPYFHWMWIFGSLTVLFNLSFILQNGFGNPMAFPMILGPVLLIAGTLYPVTKYASKYLSKLNYGILLGHSLDASSAFVSVSFFGYAEKHVLPRFLFAILGPWVMFPLKIGVVWGTLYFIDQEVEGDELRIWLKVVVLVLGLGLGTRNLFTVAMGV